MEARVRGITSLVSRTLDSSRRLREEYTANKQQIRYKNNKEIKGRLVRARDVLEKYYIKTDEVVYYAANLFLNPPYRVGYAIYVCSRCPIHTCYE
jgi:hypothetical protein